MFHLYLPQMRMSHEAIVDRALAAEAAGFEGIAFMDHLAPPLAERHDMWEAMSIAGWVLAKTSSLTVGHLVLCDAFRHPAVLARQAVSLDHASGGRFELGLGWGSVPTEFGVYGIGDDAPKARVDRLTETLRILDGLWSGEPFDHDGEHFTLRAAQQRPTPTARIPIVIGGTGNRTLGLVRAHADWWNVPVHQLHKVDELRPRAGDAKVSIQTMIALLDDESERDEVQAAVDARFGRGGMGSPIVIGTAPELIDHFARLRDGGVERFYCWFADFAPPAKVAAFADVVAAFR